MSMTPNSTLSKAHCRYHALGASIQIAYLEKHTQDCAPLSDGLDCILKVQTYIVNLRDSAQIAQFLSTLRCTTHFL